MAITINHQTNDLSATSGSITIDGASAGGATSVSGTGTQNIIGGTNAGSSLQSSAEYNLFIGEEAGKDVTTGDRNIFLGLEAGTNTTFASNNVAIGQRALHGSDSVVQSGGNNVAVGSLALQEMTGGTDNVGVGGNAGRNTTTGVSNVSVGPDAGRSITTGGYNVIIGKDAGEGVTAESDNVMIGREAGESSSAAQQVLIGYAAGKNSHGNKNVYIGLEAGRGSGTDSDLGNIAIGTNPMYQVTTGDYNIALGWQAGFDLTTGTYNVFMGYQAGAERTIGGYNVGIGKGAVGGASAAASTGGANVGIGPDALKVITTGQYNIALGSESGDAVTTGNYNITAGYLSGSAITTSSDNVAIGRNALATNITGQINTAVGYYALNAATSDNNVGIGRTAGQKITTGERNIAVGYNPMGTSGGVTGSDNIGIGYDALEDLTSGADNIGIGRNANANINTGGENVGVGTQAGLAITTGSNNVAIGAYALKSNDTHNQNVAIGYYAGGDVEDDRVVYIGSQCGFTRQTGDDNIGIGYFANGGASGTAASGQANVGIGRESLKVITTGNYNTAVGAMTGDSLTTGYNNVLIGYNAAASSATVANEITIGNTNATRFRLPGLQNGAANGSVLQYNSATGLIGLSALQTDLAYDTSPQLGGNLDVNGNNITSSGDMTIDVAGDIILDADDFGKVQFYDGGTHYGTFRKNGSDVEIKSIISNADIKFIGVDGGGGCIALTLDMSEAGTAIFNKDIKLPDNGKAIFGAGSDLQIYHSGSGSNIDDVGTGNFNITTNGSGIFLSKGGSENMASFETDGAVTLYYDNSTKFATTSTGVTVTGTCTASVFNATSDATLKTNIAPIQNPLDILEKITGVSFDWKENKGSAEGVLAQDVEQVLPNAVSTDEKGKKSVSYNNLVGVLIEAVKGQQEQINKLKDRLNGLSG